MSLMANLSSQQKTIAKEVLKELKARLGFLNSVGLSYLTLSRTARTLSGGEAQRIRLASQIGSGLTGVLYILDEPSIGLHQKDNERLLETLLHLRDIGNSVVVVEHDEDTIKHADWIVDVGPKAGEHGGEIIYNGELDDFDKVENSLTSDYISGRKSINKDNILAKVATFDKDLTDLENEAGTRQFMTKKVAKKAPELASLKKADVLKRQKDYSIKVIGASENNLKNIDVEFPLGKFISVTGVSGSGKSTLVNDILAKSLMKDIYDSKEIPGKHEAITGFEYIDKVVVIDQSPIGRTPRSNPATYTGVFNYIRDIFAETKEAKIRGYGPGRFSFNTKGGRCEKCKGDGVLKIEMQFLPDVFVECEACHGKRYNEDTLQIDYKGKNISQILELTVEDSVKFFEKIPWAENKLKTLEKVGLGYIRLGQSATTLSGGEAQRVKLATELSKRQTGKTVYILDEPTTGLHFADVENLLLVLHSLVAKGNTVIVIEHNLDVVKTSDWIIDLGPEGGDKGGQVIVAGSVDNVKRCEKSYTGEWLRKIR
ncbi:ATP-binding cassette domain-containing protein [bacterium]|nr:MAG: ATP-binding cassette domain-containing protein [bacterium]